jgi:hypothetical protein
MFIQLMVSFWIRFARRVGLFIICIFCDPQTSLNVWYIDPNIGLSKCTQRTVHLVVAFPSIKAQNQNEEGAVPCHLPVSVP